MLPTFAVVLWGKKSRGRNEKLFDEKDENDHHYIPFNTFQQPQSETEKSQIYSSLQECHSLFFLILAHLPSATLEIAMTAAPDSKAPGFSARVLHTLNPRLTDTSPKLCHPHGHGCCRTTTTTHQHKQRYPTQEGRMQREEDQPHSSTKKPKLDCSHYSATQKLEQSF